ncbi:glycosyltransferase family 2 protein [Mucilaginibacter terrae]|uniref:GT2 family glycosyltransferase n=1 Tax=Mucilaginibacter terrae TaxID=1955052 RepID=A0ABU3GYE4_9SPHI|nr:glycosyltransferase [Mucilaginibacter terrae]MDT3404783.1 GT2 family glycosyltransferase [Mucilaginibacter terrae]
MTFSIVIPTCNRNHLLAICLDKLLPQVQQGNYTYEIIVTDDSTGNIAKALIDEKYPWIKWVAGPKQGPAANRNNGAKNAQNQWLIFLDDDCEPDNDLVLNYAKTIESNLQVRVMEGAIYSDDVIKPMFTAPVNTTGGHLWSCNFSIQKALFDELGGFDENYKFPNLEDNDLNKRIRLAGNQVPFVSNARVYHPPRPIASPEKFARYHESWMYYHAKFGERKTLKDLLVTISRARLNTIKDAPKGWASVKALYNYFVEIALTVNNSRKWKKV